MSFNIPLRNNVINYFIKQTVICNFVLLQSIVDYLNALLSTKPLNYNIRNYIIISLNKILFFLSFTSIRNNDSMTKESAYQQIHIKTIIFI